MIKNKNMFLIVFVFAMFLIPSISAYSYQDTYTETVWGLNTQDTFHYNFEEGFYQDGSALFNGVDSRIDTGSDWIGTKAVTVMGWIKPYGWGENTHGRILDNDKFMFGTKNSNDSIFMSSDGNILITSANNSISLNKWQFVSITREADGTANFYIGDLDTAPALSGSADQNSGTPIAGTTGVIIGNNNAQTKTFDGEIRQLQVFNSIFSLAEIQYIWVYGVNGSQEALAYYPLIDNSDDESGHGYDGRNNNIIYIPQKIPVEYNQNYDAWLERTLTNPSGNYHNNAETNLVQPLAPALIQADVNSWWFDYSSDVNYYIQKDVNYNSLVFNMGDYNYTFLVDDANNQKQNMRFYSSLQTQAEQTKLQNIDYLNYFQTTWKQWSQDFNTHNLSYNTEYYSFFNLDKYTNANHRLTSTYWSDNIFIMYTTSPSITNPSGTIYTYTDYNWVSNIQDELYDENRVYKIDFGFNETTSFDGNEEYVYTDLNIPVDSNNYNFNLEHAFNYTNVGVDLFSFLTVDLYVNGNLSATNTIWSVGYPITVYNNIQGILTNPYEIIYAYQNYTWNYTWKFHVVDYGFDEGRTYDFNFGINNPPVSDGNQHTILTDQNIDMNVAAGTSGFDITTSIPGMYAEADWYSYIAINMYDNNVYVSTTTIWSGNTFELREISCILPTNSCDSGDNITQPGHCTFDILLPDYNFDVEVTMLQGNNEEKSYLIHENGWKLDVFVMADLMPTYLTCAIDINGHRYVLDHITLGLSEDYIDTYKYKYYTRDDKEIFGLAGLLLIIGLFGLLSEINNWFKRKRDSAY